MAHSFEMKMDTNRFIRGNYSCETKQAKANLIIAHGYKGFKDWGMFPYVAEKFASYYNVFTFNFSHNGIGENFFEFTQLEHFASNTYEKELEDLAFLVQNIKKNNVEQVDIDPALPLFLLGHSKGAGTSLIYTFEHPTEVDGVISWNGITNVDLFTTEQKQQMRENGISFVLNGRTGEQMPLNKVILEDMDKNKAKYDILDRVQHNHVPIIVIEGTMDGEHLIKGNDKLCTQSPSVQKVMVQGGNHTFGAVHPFQGTTEYLESALGHSVAFMEQQITDIVSR
ncbi:alpha/beta hydrolase family protein [Longirhabdus pacifica]|uniref:alpha/beta hydrolase family protein n=1 Tax=Longirhabdus pacifica TaxID=2305227 RepID=UPI0010089725|nr:alpha/beta hydrolase [Longirhabdus pacifica]